MPAEAAGFAVRCAVTFLAVDPLPAAGASSYVLSEESGWRPMRFCFPAGPGFLFTKNCE